MVKRLALVPMIDWQRVFTAMLYPLIALFRRNLFLMETEQFSEERIGVIRSVRSGENIGSDCITPEEFKSKLTLDMLCKINWFRPREGMPGEWECSQCKADLSFQKVIHPIHWSEVIDKPIPLQVVRTIPFCKCRGPEFAGLGAKIFIEETDDPIGLVLGLQEKAVQNAIKFLGLDCA